MAATLEQLVEDGIVDEVLARLKSGKEADVWLVRHGDKTLAAKIYKDRAFRSFKNDAGYKEGRAVRNSRTQRAMDRGSKFGQAAAEEAWKSAESDALHKLFAAGVRVPEPVLFYDGVLVMNLATDGEGNVAPRLIDAFIPEEQAAALYTDLRAQAIKMLTCELIHGDLSPYNVLLAAEGPTIIDFPQVVSAAHNSTAESYFKRDLENLREFFCSFDATLQARTQYDAAEIWHAYVKRDLTEDFVPSGRAPPEVRRQERAPRPGGAAPQVRGHSQPGNGQPGQRPQQGQAQAKPQQGKPQQGKPHQGKPQQGQPHQPRQQQPGQDGRPHGQQRHPRGVGPQQQAPRQAPPLQAPAPSAPLAAPAQPGQHHQRAGPRHQQGAQQHPGGEAGGPRPAAPQQRGQRPGQPGQQGGRSDANRSGNRTGKQFPPRAAPSPVVERVVRPSLGSQAGQPAPGGSGPAPGRPRRQ